MKLKNLLIRVGFIGLSISLSGCGLLGLSPDRPEVPDGSNRIPVNKTAPLARNKTPERLMPASATLPEAAAKNNAPSSVQTSFVLEGKRSSTSVIRVSLMKTLLRVADNTGLRFVRNDLPDEIVRIAPTEDPFNALRQLAQNSRYRINFDREKGRLWASQEAKQNGLFVLRDETPVLQIGSPIAKKPYPKEPIALTEALRLLAPDDFEVGYAAQLDLNIQVDLSEARSWQDGLERIALQTPYRIVFDWDKKLIYAVPTQRPLTAFKGVSS